MVTTLGTVVYERVCLAERVYWSRRQASRQIFVDELAQTTLASHWKRELRTRFRPQQFCRRSITRRGNSALPLEITKATRSHLATWSTCAHAHTLPSVYHHHRPLPNVEFCRIFSASLISPEHKPTYLSTNEHCILSSETATDQMRYWLTWMKFEVRLYHPPPSYIGPLHTG